MSSALPCYPCAPSHDCADHLEDTGRRRLLKQSALAAVAATLAAACSRTPAQTAVVPIGAWQFRIKPANFPELAHSGGIVRVDGQSDKPIAVVRMAGGYAAFSLRCPHAGATVEAKEGQFVCPGHGATFDARGTWIGGHPAKNLRALFTSYDAPTGVLTITA